MNPSADLQKLPPLPLAKSLAWFRNALTKLNKSLFPGTVVVYEQLQNLWLLPSIYIAARLDIASMLRKEPLDIKTLALRTESDAASLYRIMRALASQGIFRENSDGTFCNTRLSKALTDEKGSLRHTLLHHLGPVNWNLMSNLIHAVKTGRDPFANLYGMPIYTYLQQHPAEYALFDQSMSNLSDMGLAPLLNAYNFSKSNAIADLGGGEGYLLGNILLRYPAIKGTLFDLPEATGKSLQLLETLGVADRVTIHPGDFFSDPVPSSDLYILKNIIHNWSDEDCIRLLGNIAATMNQGASLLIIDMVVEGRNEPSFPPLLDIQMLACMEGGRERTKAEFLHLLTSAGFKVNRIIPTIAPISLIEAQLIK